MSPATLTQVWQSVEKLSAQEQSQLVQLLLQKWQLNSEEVAPNQASVQKQSPRGKYAFVPTSSQSFAQQKQEEIALER
ncbi:MAG TPA: hypothetical protein G4N96_01450 [Chloroflexi bacterium]|nr:hypothetical protein [Chloroflexota bacterium]